MVSVSIFNKHEDFQESLETEHLPNTESFSEEIIIHAEEHLEISLARKQYNLYPIVIDSDGITTRQKVYYENEPHNWITFVWNTSTAL